MKFATEDYVVRHDLGDSEVGKFRIKASAKAFLAYVQNIYSDNIAAVIRELSTNAQDAHIEAGKPNTPFDVHLPEYGAEYFYIEDYGVGLSHEEFESVYVELFNSNRSDTNDVTGGWGIGSKVPMGYYTKSCIVETWKDGIHRIYECYIGEDGIPSYGFIHEEHSERCNGVKVKVPVRSSDFSNFKTKAKRIYKYFEVKPNFVSNTKPDIDDVEYVLEGKKWGLRTESAWSNDGCKVVMGPIAYTVQFEDSSLDEEHYGLIDCPVDIYVDMGDVDIDPSRERLNYSDRTVKLLKERFDAILDDVNSQVRKEFASAKNLWQARVMYNEAQDKFPDRIIDLIDMRHMTWRGVRIFKGNESSVSVSDIKSLDLFEYEPPAIGRKRARESRVWRIKPTNKTKIFEADCPGWKSRCKYAVETSRTSIVTVKFDDKDQRKQFLRVLGADDSIFRKTSELDQPPRNAGSGSHRGKMTRVCKLVDGRSPAYCWQDDDIDLKDGGIYVEKYRYDAIDRNGVTIDPNIIQRKLNALSQVGVTIPTIYGIKKRDVKLAHKRGSWVSFWDWYDNKLSELQSQLPFYERIIANREKVENTFSSLSTLSFNTIKKIGEHLDGSHEINDFVRMYKKMNDSFTNRKYYDALEFQSLFRSSFNPKNKHDYDLVSKLDDIKEEYVLLKRVGRIDDTEAKHLSTYITAVDKENA